jgi:DNA-binding IclR family transcriptional regulator
MPRVRADLVMVGGKSPRQHIWEAIRAINASPKELTTYAVARKSQQDDQAVRAYFRDMEKAGIVSKVRNVGRLDAEWTLLKDEGVEAPSITRGGKVSKYAGGAENIWRALRILGEFNAAEAAAAASVNGVTISEFGAQVYLSGLAKAGYLTRSGGTPGKKTRFRLIPSRYTGPKHPIYQRDFNQVYDPNLDQVVWRKADEGVAE